MKRSTSITLLLMGSATLAMVACDDSKPTQAGVYSSIEECTANGTHTAAECRDQFDKAKQEHIKSGPKFSSREDCEAEFGRDRCERPSNASNNNGGGSFFMPLMMGYMVGKMMNGGGSAFSQPLYRPNSAPSGGGGYSPGTWRTSNNTEVARQTGATSVSSNAFRSSGQTTTLSRGGFGARGASVGTFGG